MLYQGANFSATEQMNWWGVGLTSNAYAQESYKQSGAEVGARWD